MGTSHYAAAPLAVRVPPRGAVTSNGHQVSIFPWNLQLPRSSSSHSEDAEGPGLLGDKYSGPSRVHSLLLSWATHVPLAVSWDLDSLPTDFSWRWKGNDASSPLTDAVVHFTFSPTLWLCWMLRVTSDPWCKLL